MKISVGLTTYNSEKYIFEQINSILQNTVLPDEIIICDDSSTDYTIEIIESLLKITNIDVKIYKNDTNIGFVKNFEKCFSLCTGDVVFSCDADDIWRKDKIEKVIEKFDNDKVVLVYHDAKIIDDQGKVLMKSLYKQYCVLPFYSNKYDFMYNVLSKKGHPFGMTIAFRRNILDKLLPFPFGHDEWISLCAPLFGEIIYIEETLSDYRRHGNNLSGNDANETKFAKIIKKIKNENREQFFNYPTYQIEGYNYLYKTFFNIMPYQINELLRDEIEFKKICIKIIDSNFIIGLFYLIKSYKQGFYQKLRGNFNTLIVDFLYLLINRTKKESNK